MTVQFHSWSSTLAQKTVQNRLRLSTLYEWRSDSAQYQFLTDSPFLPDRPLSPYRTIHFLRCWQGRRDWIHSIRSIWCLRLNCFEKFEFRSEISIVLQILKNNFVCFITWSVFWFFITLWLETRVPQFQIFSKFIINIRIQFHALNNFGSVRSWSWGFSNEIFR